MKYLKIYVKLMQNARSQDVQKPFENHHVFPKSIYGKNNFVVKLSPRQHYVAHALLYRGFLQRYGKDDMRTKKMLYAFWCMHAKNVNQEHRITNSKLYEIAREEFRKTKIGRNNHNYGKPLSETTKEKLRLANMGEKNYMYGRTGELNPFYGKKHSEETKQIISEKAKQRPGHNHSLETKEKLRLSHLGNKNPIFGKKCCNNGKKNVYAFKCPEGFVLGRIKKSAH